MLQLIIISNKRTHTLNSSYANLIKKIMRTSRHLLTLGRCGGDRVDVRPCIGLITDRTPSCGRSLSLHETAVDEPHEQLNNDHMAGFWAERLLCAVRLHFKTVVSIFPYQAPETVQKEAAQKLDASVCTSANRRKKNVMNSEELI